MLADVRLRANESGTHESAPIAAARRVACCGRPPFVLPGFRMTRRFRGRIAAPRTRLPIAVAGQTRGTVAGDGGQPGRFKNREPGVRDVRPQQEDWPAGRSRAGDPMRIAARRASGYPPKVGPDGAQISLAALRAHESSGPGPTGARSPRGREIAWRPCRHRAGSDWTRWRGIGGGKGLPGPAPFLRALGTKGRRGIRARREPPGLPVDHRRRSRTPPGDREQRNALRGQSSSE